MLLSGLPHQRCAMDQPCFHRLELANIPDNNDALLSHDLVVAYDSALFRGTRAPAGFIERANVLLRGSGDLTN